MKNGVLALSLLAFAAADSLAAEVTGVKVPDNATVGGQELVLNGAGMRSRLFLKVYIGALYLPRKTSSAAEILGGNQPRRMALALQRDVSADQLLEAVRAGLADNHSQAELDAIQTQVDQFLTIFKLVGQAKTGQLITIDYTPADGTRISLDGAAKGTIAGEAFGKALFKTWLGEKPVQESLKKALLGAG
ncbi:MAG: chalcone isomerase family protein [Betaproteobacteria bacterium]